VPEKLWSPFLRLSKSTPRRPRRLTKREQAERAVQGKLFSPSEELEKTEAVMASNMEAIEA
jgi:hypothetical protein